MYRVLSRQNFNIYCENPHCNLNCDLFHKNDCDISGKSLRERRPVIFRVQSLDLGSRELPENNKPAYLSTNSDGERSSYLNVVPNAIEPITPLTVSGSSTVTLDDIIASAKRKISQEFEELRLPSPVIIETNENERRHSGSNQSIDDDHNPDLSFLQNLVDSDDDDWLFGDPPSVVEQGEQEDFDQLLKDTKPPKDHYSNPLYREADPLNKRRRKAKMNDDDSSSVDLSVADISLVQFDLEPNIAILHSRLTDDPADRTQYEGNL
ncbi:hypothetical protein M3Y94_00833600 [Aphelenchoides besseyi]|nr:hypothetical protein M3Y94_00833600 [Aphelenchoides besseyi]KAI6226993.1 hypothetical protein M3Y95_00680000 [Aphelenchoides besseyi]